MSRHAEKAWTQFQGELQGERVSALGRIGRRLAELIEEAHRLRPVAESAPEDERPARVEEFRKVREQAKTWQWYLVVQREAVGFRGHAEVDRSYAIPPDVDVSPARP